MLFEKAVPINARRSYRLDAWSGILAGIYSGAISPFFLLIARERLNAGPFLIGLMTASLFLGNLLSLLWANAMEGRKKMPFVAGSWYLARGAFLLMIFATTPLRFAIIVSVAQFLATIASPAYAAIMKDVYPDEHRGRIMGYSRVLVALFMIVSALAVGWLLKYVSHRWIFPFGAILGIISAYAFSRIQTSDPSTEELANKRSTLKFLKSSFSILLENRGFAWFASSVFVYGFGTLLLSPVYPIFQNDSLHITYWQLAVLTNIQSILWMVSYLYWGRYVDVKSPLKATVINVSAAILVPLGYCISFNWWMLIPAHIVAGITNAGIEMAYFNSVMQFSDEGRISHYQALFACILGIRGVLAPFVGAWLISSFVAQELDIRYIFLIGVAILLVGTMMQIAGLRRVGRSKMM